MFAMENMEATKKIGRRTAHWKRVCCWPPLAKEAATGDATISRSSIQSLLVISC